MSPRLKNLSIESIYDLLIHIWRNGSCPFKCQDDRIQDHLTSIEQKTKDPVLAWVLTMKSSFHFSIQYCSFYFLSSFFFQEIHKISIYKPLPRLEGWAIKLNLILWGWVGLNPSTAVLYTHQDLLTIYGHVCRDKGLTVPVLPEIIQTQIVWFWQCLYWKEICDSLMVLWNDVTTCECVSHKFRGC